MRRAVISILVGLGGVAHAQAVGDRVFDTRTNASYRTAPTALGAYLDAAGKTGVHHFCVVGFRGRDMQRAWVYWPEGRQIILWDEAADPKFAAQLLVSSRRALDLDHDVVETSADIHHSTYLVTRDWVRRIRRICSRQGAKYEIHKP